MMSTRNFIKSIEPMTISWRILSLCGFLGALSAPAAAQPIFTTAPPELSRVYVQKQQLGAPTLSAAAPAARDVVAETAQAVVAQPAPQPQVGGPALAPTPSPLGEGAPHITEPATIPPPPFVAEQKAANARNNAPVGPSMRHLTNNATGFRLSGEIASSEWPIYLTASQARQPLQFQLGYITAVSVMPEASFLTLIVNDKIAGRVNIRAASQVRSVAFDIPPNLMQPGFNSVRLTAEHRHRVDCSLTATYELWTQIDPSQTGIVIAKNEGVRSLSDLAALSPDSQGALPIRAVTPDRSTLASIERYVQASQLISLVGRFTQPVVDYGPMADGAYGVNLVIGQVSEIRNIVPAATLSDVIGPRILVLPAQPDRRTTVIVTGQSDQQVNEALGLFKKETELTGAPAGVRAAAAFPGYRLEGGQRVRLRDLGVASEEFSGRLFRASFNVVMPTDFFSADYAKAQLELAGGYSAGLTSDAKILVSVNGANAVSLKLPKQDGDVFAQNAVPLPLGAMRPGLNRIEIEAHAPMESDQACDPIAAISGAKRFLLLDSTELVMPKIARIARMPDLTATTTGGFPFTAPKAPKLVLPSPDRETIGAATTIATQLGIAAGRPIAFKLLGELPKERDGAALVVGGANMLGPDILKAAGVDPALLQSAWSSKFETQAKPVKSELLSRQDEFQRRSFMLENNYPSACTMPGAQSRQRVARMKGRQIDMNPTGSVAPARVAARRAAVSADMPTPPIDRTPTGSLTVNEPSSGALYDEWLAKVRKSSSWAATAGQWFERASAWFSARWSDTSKIVAKAVVREDGRETAVSGYDSALVAQFIDGSRVDDVVTLITAPNSSYLGEVAGCLVDPRVWMKIAGRMSSIDASNGQVAVTPAGAPRLISTQPFSIGNTRLIVAGWLSLNTATYVVVAFALALLLALTTTLFVRNVGRRQQ